MITLSSIVAIHGLGGHRESTWTDEKTQSMWLRDFLQYDIPDARILTFGYDSDPSRTSGPTSTLFLREHAKQLLGDLLIDRKKFDLKVCLSGQNPSHLGLIVLSATHFIYWSQLGRDYYPACLSFPF